MSAFEHENTPFGSYGEFEPVADDVDWDAHDEEAAQFFSEREEMEYSDWEAEMYAAQWDDDPNPYHGDYSEM